MDGRYQTILLGIIAVAVVLIAVNMISDGQLDPVVDKLSEEIVIIGDSSE